MKAASRSVILFVVANQRMHPL